MPTSRERVPLVIVEYDEIARTIARRIADIIRERRREGGHAVLGLATGSTPIGIYRELIKMHRDEGLDFSDVVTFNLDEYYPMKPDSIHSYHRFMRENLFNHINVRPENIHIPRGDVPRDDVDVGCEAYETAIKKAGGIDLQILGIGKTGHIGFNEPGSGSDSRTRRISLDTVTREGCAPSGRGRLQTICKGSCCLARVSIPPLKVKALSVYVADCSWCFFLKVG